MIGDTETYLLRRSARPGQRSLFFDESAPGRIGLTCDESGGGPNLRRRERRRLRCARPGFIIMAWKGAAFDPQSAPKVDPASCAVSAEIDLGI